MIPCPVHGYACPNPNPYRAPELPCEGESPGDMMNRLLGDLFAKGRVPAPAPVGQVQVDRLIAMRKAAEAAEQLHATTAKHAADAKAHRDETLSQAAVGVDGLIAMLDAVDADQSARDGDDLPSGQVGRDEAFDIAFVLLKSRPDLGGKGAADEVKALFDAFGITIVDDLPKPPPASRNAHLRMALTGIKLAIEAYRGGPPPGAPRPVAKEWIGHAPPSPNGVRVTVPLPHDDNPENCAACGTAKAHTS